jgi:hypothetical protein
VKTRVTCLSVLGRDRSNGRDGGFLFRTWPRRLNDDQRKELDAIDDDLQTKNWEIMGKTKW